MRWIFCLFILFSLHASAQYKSYQISVKGDTLNAVDQQDRKQGKWIHRYEEVRGEPGFEEEGEYVDGRKEGKWRKYTLMGDLIAIENYRWGYKDGVSQYFNALGELLREESWKALNPDKQYDTLDIEDVDKLNSYKRVIVKNEGAGIRHGSWKYYDPISGFVDKTEIYVLGALQNNKSTATVKEPTAESKAKAKPKEVLDFEKKNAGKKKVRVQDGSTGL